ncbi:protein SODIUM POTASSIUM ROOT DEFECTIVE 1-like [Vitis riparia]|uniref:protein SODIUM POTASSIUM ROOT DEFECTIVE 1-like n=1 Tax=Vitis riparia TaxID=96939 RepID=UPI00155A2A9D|nr:protein SODIUM POTASSIUM ROOT DEFECTIVE 1-like [Vitis riparia]
MKGVDLFCASPASTAICSSMDQRSMVRRGTRPINHHNPYLGDRRRSRPLAPVPCSSRLPISPTLHHQKSRKSSAKQTDLRRKSSADKNDLTSPPGSSRYLLSDTPFFNLLPDSDRVSAFVPTQTARPLVPTQTTRPLVPTQTTRPLVPTKTARPRRLNSNDSPALVSSSSARSHDQVVVLWVSLHCKGCEGKLRKHISKMEGVTSFSIDLATKKVTVIGDVTPLGVLASVSRVKNAQLWPSPTSSSSPLSSSAMTSLTY